MYLFISLTRFTFEGGVVVSLGEGLVFLPPFPSLLGGVVCCFLLCSFSSTLLLILRSVSLTPSSSLWSTLLPVAVIPVAIALDEGRW